MPRFQEFPLFLKRFLLVLGAFAILPLLLVRGLVEDIKAKEGLAARVWTFAKAVPRIVYLTAIWGALVGGIVFGFAHMLFAR